EDTGPMTRKRMETADEEFMAASLAFIDKAHDEGKPFFVWHNSTRMHVWTHLKPASQGVTGIGLYPDGMVEHDQQVGTLLKKLDDLGIADNTIVIYSTDNGAETISWPDGGTTPFHGEKGTTWEGGFRVPMVVRWPGTVEPGMRSSEIISHEDWLPTLLAAAGESDVVDKLKKGHRANGKRWKVHLDGHDFGPYFRGEVADGPRDSIFYFAATGDLNAVRVQDFKAHFAVQTGGINTAVRQVTAWPLVVNLKADPYEKAALESEMYIRWYAENTMWIFVPIQQRVAAFLATLKDYPLQDGASLSASNINYTTLKAADILKRLGDLNSVAPSRN
ncbi:MAG: sulfatase-like hydrolase/transferase, partial [Pseudomonadota bacterium]